MSSMVEKVQQSQRSNEEPDERSWSQDDVDDSWEAVQMFSDAVAAWKTVTQRVDASTDLFERVLGRISRVSLWE